ncbi:px domain containing protein [Stylonychia lemnae]|uniref:Px domain containing protein n=1 Tax=Stylonychia lemnae TaxID=5949 RepID=A0A078AL77_STYLE|nr:px domain containing protein [Stylonychia lemnae]|eukprot:CDW82631.1 px domain containing protein [Stylonychia lemnae]
MCLWSRIMGLRMRSKLKMTTPRKKISSDSSLSRNQTELTNILKQYYSFQFKLNQAYQALDFQGKGFVDVNDFVEGRIIYKLPFSKNDLREFLVNETIFKKQQQLKIEVFTKNFFPNKLKEPVMNNQNGQDFSDSDKSDEEEINNDTSRKPMMAGTKSVQDFTINDSLSKMSSSKNRDINNKMKHIEDILKERLSNNWVSVRKAFLDLDEDFDGFVTAENFAKLIGGSSGSSKFDFNLLKMLIKMRNSKLSPDLNYTEFCRWFGAVIEPVEAFYFRHDSMKNPQYEKNIQKTVLQYAGGQKKIRELISNKNLKERFIDKLHNQFKSCQRAFTEMNRNKSGFIQQEEFFEIIKSWGFDASDQLLKELFDWLDYDKDSKISYEDLRSTAGQDVSPMEQLFFRQDVKPAKMVTCKYEKCWENNNFNSKSIYCPLHQKIMRNLCLDKFSGIAEKADEDKWNQLVKIIIDSDYQMKIKELANVLQNVLGIKINNKEKEFIWETFKVKQYLEDNPDDMNERLVSLQALINSRKQSRLKKINQLMNLEADDEQAAEDIKLKGLSQIDEAYIKQIATLKKANWGGIWRSIKKIDKDSNGFVTIDELEEIFKEWFPIELEGKTCYHYFKRFGSVQNRNLINYKKIKDSINEYLIQTEIKGASNLNKLENKDEMLSIYNQSKSESTKQQKHEQQELSDDEENLKIEGQSQKPLGDYSIMSGYGGSISGKHKGSISKINSRQIIAENRQTLPTKLQQQLTERRQSNHISPLPQMNMNSSIQKINDMQNLELNIGNETEDYPNILNNRSTTPVMSKAYKNNSQTLLTKNKSLNRLGPLSQISIATSAKSLKFNEDVKVKLAYEWKNVYRSLAQADSLRKGTVPIGTFNKIIHQHKVYLSREELRKIESLYGASNSNPLLQEIDYVKISQELGLHRQSLDFIKPKNLQYVEQLTKIRDTPSRGSVFSKLSRSQIGMSQQYPLTDRQGGNDSIINGGRIPQNKLSAAREFISAYDKQKTGMVSLANFQKVLRIFGVQSNQNQFKANEVGMIDYEKALETLSVL